MIRTILFYYGIIWAAFFTVCTTIGVVLRKEPLHGGVKLGFVNSFLLSAAWPITILLMLFGWGYDAVASWKKL